MKVIKDKQFLIFYLPNNKTCRYDLSTGITYGFSGKPVKSINSQLKGHTISDIINSIEEEPYRKFLCHIHRYTPNVSNFGSLLTVASRHRKEEQFFTAGVPLDYYFKYSISEVPKGLIKLCKEYNIVLSNELYNIYIKNPDRIYNILNLDLNFKSSTDILKLYLYSPSLKRNIDSLLDEYNYNFKSLFTYLDNLYTYEALYNSLQWTIQELYDYVRMSSMLSKHYNKYPQHFLSTLVITRRNYDRLKVVYDEIKFSKIYSEVSSLYEKQIKKYSFIYPKKIQDIKDEAVSQNNCVASYIDRVLSRECDIMFMRETKHPEQSLITLEIKDNRIVQARGAYNRMPTVEENEAIISWNNAA